MDPDLKGSKRGWEVKTQDTFTCLETFKCYKCGHFSKLIGLTASIHLSNGKRWSDAEIMRNPKAEIMFRGYFYPEEILFKHRGI